MKLSVQFVSDSKGNTKAVQLPLTDWNKLVDKLKKYEEVLKIKSDLTAAFNEVELMRKGKIKKQTLAGFLDEL